MKTRWFHTCLEDLMCTGIPYDFLLISSDASFKFIPPPGPSCPSIFYDDFTFLNSTLISPSSITTYSVVALYRDSGSLSLSRRNGFVGEGLACFLK